MAADGELVMRVNVENLPDTEALVKSLRDEVTVLRVIIAREIMTAEADALRAKGRAERLREELR